MHVMTGSALHLRIEERNLSGGVHKGSGNRDRQCAVGSGQGGVIRERNGMIITEIGYQSAGSTHFVGARPGSKGIHRDGAVVATQACLGGGGGLADGVHRVKGWAAATFTIKIVRCRGGGVVPQGGQQGGLGVVGRMAEYAGLIGAPAVRGQVVLGSHDGPRGSGRQRQRRSAGQGDG